MPHTGLKKEALQAYLILIKKLKVQNRQKELNYMKMKFEGLLTDFQKDSSPEIKLRLQDVTEQLKQF